MACPYCYARRMYKRFHWDETIRFDQTAMDSAYLIQKQPQRKRIFVGSTMELFGEWVKPDWMQYILDCATRWHWNDYIFLTKRPENLQRWVFPDNVWVGASVTSYVLFEHRLADLGKADASVKFLSFEPLLKWLHFDSDWLANKLTVAGIKWVIVGQQTPTSASTAPQLEWIKDIVEAADQAGCKVFLKDNLGDWRLHLSCYTNFVFGNRLRQEFPAMKEKAVVGSP